MGMFDTILLDRTILCPICNSKIDSVQTKNFENLLETYQIKDCIGHAEDVKIIKEELYCDNCKNFTGKNIYISINRGILIGTTESLKEGKELLNDLNLEKIVFWYHDQYKKYKEEQFKKNSYRNFLFDLYKWYEEKLNENPQTSDIQFINNFKYLKGAKDPLESIERFLSHIKMKEALDNLWSEGHETLNIYYAEDIPIGHEKWFVDVYQDELDELCKTNWTWTILSRKELEEEGVTGEELNPEWNIFVDEPFSEDVVKKAIENWLKIRCYKFEIKIIPLEEGKSKRLKELKERLTNNLSETD